MTNRHRFWTVAALTLAMLVPLSACKEKLPRPVHALPQLSPDISQRLAPAPGSITSPNASLQDAAANRANQKSIRVGLLLPLTGRSSDLGKAMQDAATVALFDKYARLSTTQQHLVVELVLKDTGDTAEQAAEAAKTAIAEGAQFIIGPLYSDATEAIAPIARAKSLSVLSLSNNRARAQSDVYMFGFSPEEQTKRIVTYAISQGRGRIAVLAPDSPLGETVYAAAVDAARSSGSTLAASARYSAQGVNIDAALNKLMPAGEPGFDALLIPESGAPLATILRALAARGVTPDKVQFLGTGMWDDATLIRKVNLEGAWFASSPTDNTAQFENRFRATYNYTPPRIASLAYDAVTLAVTLATSERPFNASALTANSGFIGPANGIFRLRANGTVERALAVLQVQGGGFKVLSAPPTGFTQ